MRVAAYARYSSDSQREASLEDQLRNCRAYAERQGWPEPSVYTDAAISGARADRPGYRLLLSDVERFDVLLVDDLSRLSRDSTESARTVKRLTFAGVRLVGVSDGVDTARKSHKADVGLRGLMSELYLDDLADKTHRGLAGRALKGASAGGLPYGYRVTAVGERAIDPEQAAIVRRIYAEYIAGHSARTIADGLNRDRIKPARGTTWAMSAIYGDMRRGIGILANPIYHGRQIWNRSHWIKHPETGRRVRKERPESEWIISDVPELAIIDRATWDAAQARMRQRRNKPHATTNGRGGPGRPPKHLLSGLLRCAECGGPMVIVDRYRYGCARHKDKGDAVCSSRLRVARAAVEDALLAGIREQLLTDDAFAQVQRRITAALKRSAPDVSGARRRLQEAERERANIMRAIRAGIITSTTKAEMEAAEEAVRDAGNELAELQQFQPTQVLPRARERWASIVADLADISRDRVRAREALRKLLGDQIVMHEKAGEIYAEIAGPSDSGEINVVAGARSVLYLTEPVRIHVASKPERES